MKNLLIIILLFLSSTILFGQSSSCINNTNTDPFNSYSTNTFKNNNFNWMQSGTSLYIPFSGNPAPSLSSITNFFYYPNPYTNIQNAAGSDFRPEDGWELIKQDLGFYYKNGQWDGGQKNTNDPLNVQLAPSYVAYIVLYNKYNSTLRVLTYAPQAALAFNNIIYTTLSFKQSTSQNPQSNFSTYKINALFNNYNSYNFALDKNTIVTRISTPCISPVSNGSWFYADFQLAYDPCVCFFDSGLEVTFYNKTSANISLTGRFAGVSSEAVASYSNGAGSMKGNNSADAYISSIFDNGGSPSTILQNYFSDVKMVNNYNALHSNVDLKENILKFSSGLKGLSSIAGEIIKKYSVSPFKEKALIAKETLSKGSDVLNFLSTKIKDNTLPQPEPVSVISGYLEATGTITYNDFNFPGYSYPLGLPGAQNSGGLGEFSPTSSSGVLPTYPMYNEPTGLFALLKTPRVEEYKLTPNVSQYCQLCPELKIKFAYHALGDLSYIFNPIINASKSNVYIKYEIDGMPYTDENYSATFYDNKFIGGYEFLYNDYGDIPTPSNPSFDMSNSFVKKITQTYPISCNQNIFTSETYKAPPTISMYNVKWEPHDRVFLNRNVILVVMLDLVSNPDKYGKEHRIMQIMKYKCDVIPSGTDFTTSGNGLSSIEALNQTNDLLLTNNVYTTLFKKYSYGTISITGTQTNDTPANQVSELIAEKEIQISNESIINGTGETYLYTSELPSYFNTCSNASAPPFSGNLSDYCKNQNLYGSNQGYQANSRLASAGAQSNPRSYDANSYNYFAGKTKDSFNNQYTNANVNVYPNPTNGLLNINLFSQVEMNNCLLSIENMDGKILLQNSSSFPLGFSHNELDLHDYASGVYILKIINSDGQLIKTEKIIINH